MERGNDLGKENFGRWNKFRENRRRLEIMTEIEQNEVKHTRRQKEMRKKCRISEDESREGDDREIVREVKRRLREKKKWREG